MRLSVPRSEHHAGGWTADGGAEGGGAVVCEVRNQQPVEESNSDEELVTPTLDAVRSGGAPKGQ